MAGSGRSEICVVQQNIDGCRWWSMEDDADLDGGMTSVFQVMGILIEVLKVCRGA